MGIIEGKTPKDILLFFGLGTVLLYTTLTFFGLVQIWTYIILIQFFQIPYSNSIHISMGTAVVSVFILLWIYYRISKMQN